MSVSSLNTKIKSLLEATFMHTLVEGEVASCTYHTSGHLYFSIKDDKSSIKCVMWRSSVSRMKFRIEKGMHIVVEGSVSVYTPRGEYQFQTLHIEPYGKGALALAYEQLKEKLKTKGYFDPQKKKELPRHVQKIALVTAKESAALYDMLKIIQNRWALVEVFIVDTLVQGDKAGADIAQALRYADTLHTDVVVVGRGGGSAEDLWAFNEEVVADAIFSMKTPVVSAVGHEVDVMISDFVADKRASTPSAAIEMILPDSAEILYTLDELSTQLSHLCRQNIQKSKQRVQHLQERLFTLSPSRTLAHMKQQFSLLDTEYKRQMKNKFMHYSSLLPALKETLKQNIKWVLHKKYQDTQLLEKKILLHNPKLQCQIGWAKISQNEKSITLKELKESDKFTLEDRDTKIEAICLTKR